VGIHLAWPSGPKRNIAGNAGGDNARLSVDPPDQFLRERQARRFIRIVFEGQRDLSGQDVVGAKSRRDSHRPFETEPEQACPGQKYEGQRDLSDDEAVSQSLSGVASCAPAGNGLKRVCQMASDVEPCDRSGEHDPQRRRSGNRNHCHPRIEGNAACERQAICTQNAQKADSAGRHHDTQ